MKTIKYVGLTSRYGEVVRTDEQEEYSCAKIVKENMMNYFIITDKYRAEYVDPLEDADFSSFKAPYEWIKVSRETFEQYVKFLKSKSKVDILIARRMR